MSEIREPEAVTSTPEPEVEMQRIDLDEEMRVAIVGAGGYGRVALDVLLASGFEDRILGFYDDAHAALSGEVRGVPILGDVGMLKSMLSVETVHVVVAITDNGARLRVANSLRGLGARFLSAVHPEAYVSGAAVVGDGCVVAAGAVVDRDAEVGAGTWISAGAIVGPGARVGARVILGQNSSVGRKAVVDGNVEVGALRHVGREEG